MNKRLKQNKPEIVFLLLIISLAAFFRFRGLDRLSFFTYDQARDALFIKRILDGKLRLIGTQSSIPGLYTGPFYYYLMAPFLALFRLNPVGLDFATALFSLLSIILLFKLLKESTGDSFLSLLIAALFAFSPQIVSQSRFAWNPNPLPFFTLIFLYSLKKVFLEEKEKFLALIAFSIGIAINLHYSGLAFLPVIFLIWFIFRLKVENKSAIAAFFSILLGFFLPLLIFDLRHQFINIKNIFQYFFVGTRAEIAPPPFWAGLWQKFINLFGLVFALPDFWLKILTGFCLFFGFVFCFKELKSKKSFLTLCFLTLMGGALFSCFYRGSFFFFYLTFLYPLPFLLLAMLSKRLLGKIHLRGVCVLVFIGLVLRGGIEKMPVSAAGFRKIDRLTGVAEFLSDKIEIGEKFNLVGLCKDGDRFDHNAVDYRYFLEAKFDVRAPGWDVLDYQQAETLYLISEIGRVEPLGLNVWELLLFDPQVVVEAWDLGSDVVIYKLVRSFEH